MTLPCPTLTEDAARAPAAATAGVAALPALPVASDTPTDPACPGRRHGNVSAVRHHGCRCPEVLEYLAAYRRMLRERHDREVAAGLRPPPPPKPKRPPFDEGDVEAAVVAALRWRPLPEGLTRPERIAVAHRLHRMPGNTWYGAMSASEIGQRMGLTTETAQKYLSTTVAEALAARLAGRADDEDAAEAVAELVAA